uniref:NADH-ubiquinone oxidoreductase chain 3 n=1 Tax=Opiliones sp. MT-2014 TaxID=1560019 RepID=A0A0A0RV75_9ARAC|nr:NADH dehydrogenase subunit 3 [Opiliones sp. MT-2014]
MLLAMTAALISTLFMLLTSNIAKAKNYSNEKASPFECGFNPLYKNRLPFSLQFFLIALIFIIFDIEIILVIPAPLTIFNHHQVILSIILLILILTLGLFHEWKEGSLNWA